MREEGDGHDFRARLMMHPTGVDGSATATSMTPTRSGVDPHSGASLRPTILSGGLQWAKTDSLLPQPALESPHESAPGPRRSPPPQSSSGSWLPPRAGRP